MIRILLLSRYNRLGASSRVRFLQYLPTLRTLDIEVHVSPLLHDDYLCRQYSKQPISWGRIFADYAIRIKTLFSAREFDLLWIEKELFPNLPAYVEQLLVKLGVRYVVDYDDAIFHNYDLSQNPIKSFFAKKIDEVMRCSSLVVCGNEYLADRARSAGARNVEIIPTVIDLDTYTVAESRPSGRPIIVGWVGSPSTVKYLNLVVPVLNKLAEEFPIRLCVVGAQFASPELDIECRAWSEESEVSEIQNFDIGIMPLVDSPWERGKCGYKLIQYMACGLPVVASPVGVNQQIVNHGVNGYLASTAESWRNAFRMLFVDDVSRRIMGAQGRRDVEQKYCLQVTAPHLARLFNEVVE